MRDFPVLDPEALASDPVGRGHQAVHLGPHRRQAYQKLLPVVALALLPGALLGSPAAWPPDAFHQVAFPLLGLLLLAVWLGSFQPRLPLGVLRAALLLGAWVYLLGHLAYALFGSTGPVQLAVLSASAPWIIMVLLSHAWMLDSRHSRGLSRVVLGVLGILTLVFLLADADAWRSPVAQVLLQLLGAGVVALGVQGVALRHLHTGTRRGLLGFGEALTQDALTGLPDRPAVERLLSHTFARRPQGLAVAVISLDHVTRLREDHGETFIQHLTAHVGRVLVETVRDEDVVGCLKPTEFAVLLRVPDSRAARAACERLRVRVASRPLEGVNPTISVGVAFYNGQQASAQALLEQAQDTLRDLRADGFNRVNLACQEEEHPAHSQPGGLQAV